jgi:hypothetical protein
MDISFQRLVSIACGAGSVILCESEYISLKLFKKKANLFFLVCQIAILSSAIATLLTSLIYFIPDLRILPMLIIITLILFIMDVSYPIMLLLRLKIICNFNFVFMLIPVLQGIIWAALKYFWINWILTGNNYYFEIYSILQPITTVSLVIQSISINVFFIILAKKKFENIIHVKYVIIVNVIVILLECVVVTTEFLFLSTWNIISIVSQIKIRLEISVLVYIVSPHHEIGNQLLNI